MTDPPLAPALRPLEGLGRWGIEIVESLGRFGSFLGQAVATMVTQLYDTMLSPRQGRVSITPLVKPNSLLLIGRKESIDSAKELITKLDQTVNPENQFEIFRLRHASAVEVQELITQFYIQRSNQQQGGAGDVPPGLAPRVIATADYRTNSLIVQASPASFIPEMHPTIGQMVTVANDRFPSGWKTARSVCSVRPFDGSQSKFRPNSGAPVLLRPLSTTTVEQPIPLDRS